MEKREEVSTSEGTESTLMVDVGFLRRPEGPSRLRAEIAHPDWYCYILRNKDQRYAHLTYNGSTNNPKRRLRQHNGEISGGAVYTKRAPANWEIYFLITGFPDHKNTLSCEWRMKHTEGKPRCQRPSQHRGPAGRIVAMNDILKLEKWTQQCQHNNSDHQFTIYLADDVLQYIDLDTLPDNVVYGGSVETFLQTI
jgi:predicted GIY-YIG superfamily endonuclease